MLYIFFSPFYVAGRWLVRPVILISALKLKGSQTWGPLIHKQIKGYISATNSASLNYYTLVNLIEKFKRIKLLYFEGAKDKYGMTIMRLF